MTNAKTNLKAQIIRQNVFVDENPSMAFELNSMFERTKYIGCVQSYIGHRTMHNGCNCVKRLFLIWIR